MQQPQDAQLRLCHAGVVHARRRAQAGELGLEVRGTHGRLCLGTVPELCDVLDRNVEHVQEVP